MHGADVEILVSDRHCHDDTLARLRARFSDDEQIRFLEAEDGLDWVSHINLLLKEGRGAYWRLLPHDDISPRGSLEALARALDQDQQAILTYGPTRAIDGAGAPLADKDRPRPHPVSEGEPWKLGLSLDMFWEGYFNGAFKGMLRRQPILDAGHLIAPTRDLIFSERAWLFGVCLLGPLRFVEEAPYVKRFHEQSTHAQWKIAPRHIVSATQVMIGYARRYIADRKIQRRAALYLIQRARQRLRAARANSGSTWERISDVGDIVFPAWRPN